MAAKVLALTALELLLNRMFKSCKDEHRYMTGGRETIGPDS